MVDNLTKINREKLSCHDMMTFHSRLKHIRQHFQQNRNREKEEIDKQRTSNVIIAEDGREWFLIEHKLKKISGNF